MSAEQTVSFDTEKVECPECGELNSLTDDHIDGTLQPGLLFHCHKCCAQIKVVAIDWDPSIYCEAVFP